MNVTKPEKEKTSISAIIIYTVSILACIIAVIIVICTGFFENDNLGNTSTDTSQEIDTQILKVEFNNIFDNKLDIKNTNIEVKKLENEKDIVFTDYQRKETKENNYDLDLNIPKINVDTDTIKKYNQEISDTFIKKAENILASSNSNSIYTVQYAATIEDDILSLVIQSNLKDGNNAQRVIVLTYNYDLKNNEEISLKDLLERKNINIASVENDVRDEISSEKKRVENLKALGYSVFERNPDDSRYKVENTKQFFIEDSKIYLIYAYGNDNLTTEMDLVVVTNI